MSHTAGSSDGRQKLLQILRELVLVKKFLGIVVRFDEKIEFCLILLKEVGDFLLVLGHCLRARATSGLVILLGSRQRD